LDDFTSSAVATGAVAAFFFGGLSYDVTFGVRKRFICEDSWDARSSRAFPGCMIVGFFFSSLFFCFFDTPV
jgi:hypothetical protein